ncbi:MAG: YvcK family protein [Candidatus Magasanikbacteria bacterium]|nr:YvcK family protein [Candidatus Magasanikbacteria bacterium]
MISNAKKEIVVIGGGTGTFTVLSGLRNYNVNLTAIVSMADDGGSTGTLRSELGVLPPGDVRQCLVALSTSDAFINKLVNHRFTNGSLKGHNFGNILISALEQVTGSFDKAIEKAGEILNIKGRVIPVTLEDITLMAKLENGMVLEGEHTIDTGNLTGLEKIYLKNSANANSKAIKAIENADLIIIGPGDVYTSLLPNLLIQGISKVIQKNKNPKMFICNLMNKPGHTNNFSIVNLTEEIEKYLKDTFDFVLFNTAKPLENLTKIYKEDGQETVSINLERLKKRKLRSKTKFFGTDLLSPISINLQEGDNLKRSLVRHSPEKLAKLIFSVL